MTTDVQHGPLEHAPALASSAKKSWREKRWERRRRRLWLEEMLGWILVPIILLAAYWVVDRVLAAMGTSPTAIIDGVSAILSGL